MPLKARTWGCKTSATPSPRNICESWDIRLQEVQFGDHFSTHLVHIKFCAELVSLFAFSYKIIFDHSVIVSDVFHKNHDVCYHRSCSFKKISFMENIDNAGIDMRWQQFWYIMDMNSVLSLLLKWSEGFLVKMLFTSQTVISFVVTVLCDVLLCILINKIRSAKSLYLYISLYTFRF